MATHLKEFHNGLSCKLIDHVEGTWTIGGAGIVAQIEIVVLGKLQADAIQNRETAKAAVEDANGAGTT